MEDKKLEELLEQLKSLKDKLMGDVEPVKDEHKKELIEKFTELVNNGEVKSVVFGVDGQLAMSGSRLAIISNILTLVFASIDNGIFNDYEDFINNFNEFKDL